LATRASRPSSRPQTPSICSASTEATAARCTGPAYAQRPQPKPGKETAEALLASVPGISTSSARALLERFGSVAAVVAADPAEWLTVSGIGPERVRALDETLNHRRNPAGIVDQP
jgi:ERCC4-type nuclease